MGTIWEKHFLNKTYGKDLKLLLIMYYVEGRFAVNGPSEPKVGNYLKKDKDIRVAITVTSEMFHNKNEFERREFIVDSISRSINLVIERVHSKKLDIKFDELLIDFHVVERQYLRQKKSLGS